MKSAEAGISYSVNPLLSWNNKQLEYQLNKLASSHLILLFNYACQALFFSFIIAVW